MRPIIKRALVLSAISAASALAVASPITNLTTKMSDYFSSGALKKTSPGFANFEHTLNKGASVDLNQLLLAGKDLNRSDNEAKSDTVKKGAWLQFSNGLDETFDDLLGPKPLEIAEEDEPFPNLSYNINHHHFYSNKAQLSNHRDYEKYHHSHDRLKLDAFVEGNAGNAKASILSPEQIDLNEINFNKNDGFVTYTGNGKNSAYAFNDEVIKPVKIEIPEPSILGLALLGFAGLLLNRSQRAKYL